MKIQKRIWSAILTFALTAGITCIPAGAAAAELPDDVRQGKTKAAYAWEGKTWIHQQDGTVWGWGLVQMIEDGRHFFRIMGNDDAYDETEVLSLLDGGTQTKYYLNTPTKLLEDVKQFYVFCDSNQGSTWAVKNDRTLWGTGKLLNERYGEYVPSFIKIMDDVESVNVDSGVALVVKADHTLWGWGGAIDGELGTGVVDWETYVDDSSRWYQSTPIKIMDNVVAAEAGTGCTFAIKEDGSLWVWGRNYNGQLGAGGELEQTANEPIMHEKPVKIMDNVERVYSRYGLSMALKKDGTLWQWGLQGNSIYGTEYAQFTPQKIADSVISFAENQYVKSDHTLWENTGDRLKNEFLFEKQDIMDVAEITDWYKHYIKTDGSLWWGNMQITGLPENPQRQTVDATPMNSVVLVNGKKMVLNAYTINDNNYFKLRDLAMVLSGTQKQFEVIWDSSKNAIQLFSGKPYTTVGGELEFDDRVGQSAIANKTATYKDGYPIALRAYTIAGNNYFKLRDLGEAFDFGVTWDTSSSSISIDTTKNYTAE